MALVTRLALLLALLMGTGGASAARRAAARTPPVTARSQAAASRTAVAASRVAQGPLLVLPIAAPKGLGPLGDEVRRALLSGLMALGVEAREERAAHEGEGVSGRLERGAGTALRLHLGYRDASVEVSGDLESVDKMVEQALAQLRPVLARERVLAAGPSSEDPSKGKPGKKPDELGKKPDEPGKKPDEPGKKTDESGKKPDNVGKKPDEPGKKPDEPGKKPDEPRPRDEADMAPIRSGPLEDPARVHRSEDPARVAVHVVGDPPAGQAPAPFYGVGLNVQHGIMTYLRARLGVQPVAVGLYGLRPGLEAQKEAARVKARFSLMARFDALSLSQDGYGSPTLSGRLHVVLLRDGILVTQQTMNLPVTQLGNAEPPGSAAARAAVQALSQMGGELRQRLQSPPQPQEDGRVP